jgi:hypothetical protein
MKNTFKSLSLLLMLVVCMTSYAQIKTPAASPTAKYETQVGLTNVTVEYSRPSKNGRKIFGDLVPFDKMWRTGANKNSTISFSDDVMISGTEVKKGTYAIFATPTTSMWTVVFYNDTENWGTPEKWDDNKVAAKVMVKPVANSNTETFTIDVANVTNDAFTLAINWDNISVPVKIDVPTDKKVSSNITQVMAGPAAGDYYNAARYYREAKKDLKQALTWMNKSIEMGNDKFWVYRQKSLIEADLGDYKAAINSANQSLTKAKEAGNEDYIKMNNDSIGMWSKK